MTRLSIPAVLFLACLSSVATGQQARWWKGNLHTHSLWSDGNDFPEMVADWYRSHGYQFLALSDHNILSDHEKWVTDDVVVQRGGRGGLERYRKRFGDEWVETRAVDGKLQVRLKTLTEFRPLLEEPGRFLMVQGEEITDSFEKRPIHLNASNVQELIPPQHGNSVREVIRNDLRAIEVQSRKTGHPILGHLNHPNFGWSVTAEDLAHVVEEHYFEVFNGHPSVHQLGDAQHVAVEHMWDIANTIRIATLGAPPLFGLATDDSHNYHGRRGASPGRGWVMVRATDLAPDALVEAMQRGDFYSSSGVVLDEVAFDAESGELRIAIAAEKGVRYSTRFVGTRRRYDPASAPVLGAEDEPLDVTRRYSDDIGATFATAEGPVARYRLCGDELYVRAVVTSSQPAVNPAYEGAMQQAWTQPVGW